MNPAEQIVNDLRNLPEEYRKAVRPRLRQAGEVLAQNARSRASWSKRIPPTIRVQVSFRHEREGVTVVAGGKNAPHARPYEGVRGNQEFRHPVFADSKNKTRRGWRWVSQRTRPFLLPAAEATQIQTTTGVREALDEAARNIGF